MVSLYCFILCMVYFYVHLLEMLRIKGYINAINNKWAHIEPFVCIHVKYWLTLSMQENTQERQRGRQTKRPSGPVS